MTRDEYEDEEERERPRPRVVDKRISAKQGRGTQQGEPAARPSSPPSEAPEAAAPPAGEPAPPTPPSEGEVEEAERLWTPEEEAEARRMAQQIAEAPSLEWVVNVAVTLANVAGTKLERGMVADAQLAIDSLAGVLNATAGRLEQAEGPLRQTLAQLQMAYAQAVGAPQSSPGQTPPHG